MGKSHWSNSFKTIRQRRVVTIIENSSFLKMGFIHEVRFLEEHDRTAGDHILDHNSVKWEDLEKIIDGILVT